MILQEKKKRDTHIEDNEKIPNKKRDFNEKTEK